MKRTAITMSFGVVLSLVVAMLVADLIGQDLGFVVLAVFLAATVAIAVVDHRDQQENDPRVGPINPDDYVEVMRPKDPAEAADPLDPHGDGTLREGDMMFEVMKRLMRGDADAAYGTYDPSTGEWNHTYVKHSCSSEEEETDPGGRAHD